MSAIMFAKITVKNPEKFQENIAKTKDVATTFGGELLLRAKVDKALTGESIDHALTIVVKFPSLEKINEWYASGAYKPPIALREEGSDMQITSYEVMG